MAALGRRRGRERRYQGRSGRRGRGGRIESCEKHRRSLAADAFEGDWAAVARHRMSARERTSDRYVRSDRGERRRAVKVRVRARGGGNQLPIDAEGGDRFLAAGEQAGNAFAERQVGAGTFERHYENGWGVVGEQDVRAGACQRATDAGAKSAQAFQPRSGAGGQGRGDTRDLGRRGLTAREPPRADRRGCRRPENGRACGVRPNDTVAIGAPQPSRQRTRRQRREPTVT